MSWVVPSGVNPNNTVDALPTAITQVPAALSQLWFAMLIQFTGALSFTHADTARVVDGSPTGLRMSTYFPIPAASLARPYLPVVSVSVPTRSQRGSGNREVRRHPEPGWASINDSCGIGVGEAQRT